MKKIALAVLLTLAAFVGPQLVGVEAFAKAPPAGKSAVQRAMQKVQMKQNALIAKDGPEFEVLSKHDKLFFQVFSNQDVPEGPVSGQWQAFVIRPDGKKFHGPIIDASSSDPQNFIITVQPPILDGTYTLVFYNISAQYATPFQPYIGPITVTAPNTHKVERNFEEDNAFQNPKDYFEIFFRPVFGH